MRVFIAPTITLLMLLALTMNAQGQFQRVAAIPSEPEDIGGFGNLIAGVDFDGDGKKEIYAVNNNWH